MKQYTALPPTILMIRPVRFNYNPQTAVNNAFQVTPQEDVDSNLVHEQAVKEFDYFVERLRSVDIPLLIVEDTLDPHTPDSIFPNNWITTHENDQIVLFPMFAPNRRLERKESVLSAIRKDFQTSEVIDFSAHESEDRFLEGTGSFILDRQEKIGYACLSPRTDETLFKTFCERLGYEAVVFHASDSNGVAIYHTNVMMCVADRYVVINLESVHIENRERVASRIRESGKSIIEITQRQMEAFAGNMLQIFNRSGDPYLVMSSQAFKSLSQLQIEQLEQFNPILHVPIDIIESNGGGSARCMMAEIYLKPLV